MQINVHCAEKTSTNLRGVSKTRNRLLGFRLHEGIFYSIITQAYSK